MAVDLKNRSFSLTWDGGYLTAKRGVLAAIYGDDFMEKVGAGKARSVTVKGHTRTRVIGGPAKTIAGYDYNMIDYPRRVKGGAAGGQPIVLDIDGDRWGARLGGSVQDFKAFLAGVGKPNKAFTFFTERGGEYSSNA